MAISASSISGRDNFYYKHSLPPLANQTAISQGAYSLPSASALSPSTTAYGTNANPLNGGPVYITSAQVLAQNAITNSNVSVSQNAIETGTNLQQALATISEQTPAPRFNSNNNVFTTNKTANIQPGSNTNSFSTNNIQTQSAVFESKMIVTGRNANINAQTASNIASVNANYNVSLSEQGAQALQALQNSAAMAAQGKSMFSRVDGTIPLAAATISDFSATTSSASGVNSQDSLTKTFNKMMNGDGHGGGGATLAQPKKEGQSKQGQQQSSNPFASNKNEELKKKGLDFLA